MNDMQHSDRLLSMLSLLAVIFALIVMGLGALTRLLDAGLGCPDWPGCYGHLIPVSEAGRGMQAWPNSPFIAYKAWAEMIHRYAVSLLSLLIAGVVLRVFSRRFLRTRANLLLTVGLILLLVYQIMLGQWTVTLRLWPVIVTQHLLGGILILSLLWLVFLNASPDKQHGSPLPLFLLAWFVLILLFMQIFLGAWTSTNYASLSCPDFPFCLNDQSMHYYLREAFRLLPAGVNYEGGVLPLAVQRTIQMCHRAGALLLSVGVLALLMMIFQRSLQHLATLAYGMAALLLIQVCLGIVNVLFHLPMLTAVCHTLVAAWLLLAVITLVWRMRP